MSIRFFLPVLLLVLVGCAPKTRYIGYSTPSFYLEVDQKAVVRNELVLHFVEVEKDDRSEHWAPHPYYYRPFGPKGNAVVVMAWGVCDGEGELQEFRLNTNDTLQESIVLGKYTVTLVSLYPYSPYVPRESGGIDMSRSYSRERVDPDDYRIDVKVEVTPRR